MKLLGLTPELFWSIFGGLAAIVALLYILKLRRRRVTVPFSPIWDRVLSSSDSRKWWERLKRLLSFLVQCVFLLMVVLAIADPHPEDEDLVGRQMVLLVDTSASMRALDVTGGVDRFDIARKEALKIVDSMGPKDQVMLVTMDGQLRPLTPFVGKSAILTHQIEELKPSSTPADITQAMQFMRDAIRDRANVEVYLLSDGAFAQDFGAAAAMLPESAKLHHIKVGESGQNLAITAFNVRRYLANPLDYEIYVEVRSYFKREVEVQVELRADGELLDIKQDAIKLEPEGTRRFFFPNEGFSARRLEARVRLVTADARDVFPVDDVAFAILPRAKKLNVGLVSEGNLFIEAALVANNGNVSYDLIEPTTWTNDLVSKYDVVLFDRAAPEQMPTAGNFIFVAPPSTGQTPWEVSDKVLERPLITNFKKKHGLVRWLALKSIEPELARDVTAKGGKDEVVADSFNHPLLIARREEALSAVCIAFDLRQSSIPLRVAMPILLLNAMDWVTDAGDSIVPTFRTGEAWAITVKKDDTSATITSPDGVAKVVPVYEGRAIFYGEREGFYTVKTDSDEFLIAANLANPAESKIEPPDALTSEAHAVEVGAAGLRLQGQDWWIYLVLGGIALLLLEWVTYNRRWTV